MKTTATVTTSATATSHQGKSASSPSSNNISSNNNNNNKITKSSNGLGSASSSNVGSSASVAASQRQRTGNGRVGSAKYYDIASTILGGSGDLETVFHNAAKNGNIKKLEQMLSQTGHAALDINCKDKRTGNTALMWAAKRGHSKVVELLLHSGADPTLCNYEAQTALELGFSPLKTVLLDWVDTDLPMTSLLLLHAAWQGNLAIVRKILKTKGAKDINCKNAEGLTPLMLVSRDVQLFERLAAQLNRHYNPVEVAEELIKAGADIHTTDNDGRSSLHYASQSRAGVAENLVSTLISGGMDPELRDKRLFAPIHLASQVGNTNNVVALVDGGSEVNIQGFAGLTPLHITAYNDHHKTTLNLLNHGADVRMTDDRGLTPFDLAKTRKMKITLKEAWAEATKDAEEESRVDVLRQGSKGTGDTTARGKTESAAKKKAAPPKKKPEVIFDGLVNNDIKENGTSKNPLLSTVERCKQTEKKILEDLQILKAAHPILRRENSRLLGTTRTKILPQIGRSTSPQRSHNSSPERSQEVVLLAGEEIRRSWEETRQQLISRGRSVSDIKLGLGRHSRLSLTSYDGDVLVIDESRDRLTSRTSPVVSESRTPRHHRSGSDPVNTSRTDIAATFDEFVPNSKVKRNSKPVPTFSSANRAVQPASTFITQQIEMLEDKKRRSPQQEDKFIQAMSTPLELMRCRSLLKEDFILEESRPSEWPSGSDPASSTSSLSSSSPRDSSSCVPHSPSRHHKPDPSFTTLREIHEGNAAVDTGSLSKQMSNGVLNFSQEIKPVIREPQRRIRHNSESSSSMESFNLSTDFLSRTDSSLSFRTGRSLVKTQSLKRDSKTLDSNIHKSQSLESLSPRPSDVMNGSDINVSKDIKLSNKSRSKTTQQNQSAISGDVRYESKIKTQNQEKSHDMKNERKENRSENDENALQRSQAAPFSGKARVIATKDLDRWDSLKSSQVQSHSERVEQPNEDQDCVFVPVHSATGPHKSTANQNTGQGENENSQVTKSCAAAIQKDGSQQNKFEEKRPKTSSNEKSTTSDKTLSTRNVISKSKNTQEAKSSISNQNQSIEKVASPSNGSTSKPNTSISRMPQSMKIAQATQSSTKPLVNKDMSNAPHENSKDSSKILTLQTSHSHSRSHAESQSATSEKFPEHKTPKQSDTSNNESSEPKKSYFAITDESVRLSSASKTRTQEKLSLLKQKKISSGEKDIPKMTKKVVETTTPATSKSRSVNKASLIENSIRKNQTQASLVRKSIGSSQTTAKSEISAGSKKLASSSETDINSLTKTSSTSNVFKKDNETAVLLQKSMPDCTNVSETSNQGTITSKKDTPGKGLSTPTSKSSESVKTKTLTSGNNSRKAETTSKSIAESQNDSESQTMSHSKEVSTAKALDPNVILTPRSTEPLVKIKFESTSKSQPANNPSSHLWNPCEAVISTPLIVNPFEGFSDKHNNSSDHSTKDAIVKLKKPPQKVGASSKQVGKKSTATNKRPTSGNPRKTSSAGKKRGTKNKDSKDETNKEGRVRSGKRKSTQNKKKLDTEPEKTETQVTAEASKADVALISGIGWQLSTSCVDTSNVKLAKKVNFQVSQSLQNPVIASDIFDDDDEDDDIGSDDDEYRISEKQDLSDDQDDLSEFQLSPKDDVQYKDIDPHCVPKRFDIDPENNTLEVFKEKITLNSPRFQEMKRRQESQLNFDLPVVTNDGFPPMNLDITQKTKEVNSLHDIGDEEYDNHKLRMINNHLIQNQIFIDKLTPIPEASFVTKTMNAISEFDKSLQGDKLTELLEDSLPHSIEQKSANQNSHKLPTSSVSNADKNLTKSSSSYEYTSSGKAIRRTQSMKDNKSKEKLSKERKFSETKSFENNPEEESIDEAIEEILSLSSTTSTLKGINLVAHNSHISASHTLTEEDKKVLRKLKSSSNDSPFHANALARSVDSPLPTPLREISDISPSSKDKTSNKVGSLNVKGSGHLTDPGQINRLNKAKPVSNAGLKMSSHKDNSASSSQDNQRKPPLSSRLSFNQKGTPRSDTPLKRSSSMREARSKTASLLVNESSQEKLEITEEEAKQLARVMSSLRRMELHTGAQLTSSHRDGFGGSAKIISKTKKLDSPSNPTSHSASLAIRPSSTGAAAKLKGRFHEVKEDGTLPVSSSSNKGNQVSTTNQEKGSLNQVKVDENASLQQEDGALVFISRPGSVASSIADATEIENFYIDLTARRGSLAGSECTVDSIKSEDDTIQWKKGNVLGKGAFGTVWCGLTNEGELIAVKQIELTTMDQTKAQREYEKIQEEVELLKTLEHMNIVGYLGTSLEDNVVSIFMQFIPGGSLASILARFGALDETVFRRYTKQILEGVKYLHDNDVIHRDLKGANVMLMPTGVIKLIDFGCAKRLCINLNLSQTEILKSMKGTPYWMAPEVVNETGHGKKSDIWSIGCTVFEMATRKPPWADMNPMAAIFAIGLAERPVPNLSDNFSPEAVEFVSQCLTRDQETRPSASDLLNHPFISRRNMRKVSKANSNDNSSTC